MTIHVPFTDLKGSYMQKIKMLAIVGRRRNQHDTLYKKYTYLYHILVSYLQYFRLGVALTPRACRNVVPK